MAFLNKREVERLKAKGLGPDVYTEEEKAQAGLIGFLMIFMWIFLYLPAFVSFIAMLIWFNAVTVFLSIVTFGIALSARWFLRRLMFTGYKQWLKKHGEIY